MGGLKSGLVFKNSISMSYKPHPNFFGKLKEILFIMFMDQNILILFGTYHGIVDFCKVSKYGM
jgi:hypothetical protein